MVVVVDATSCDDENSVNPAMDLTKRAFHAAAKWRRVGTDHNITATAATVPQHQGY